MSPAVLLALGMAACATACDARDETFATEAEIAEMVARGWLPPMPEEARNVRIAWNLDVNTSFFCVKAFWEDMFEPASAVEDAALPDERPDGAPGWWWEKARSGTAAIRVPGEEGGGWTLMQIAPSEFCGANLEAWRG
ncbi:MAG TPA: hypothetical protein VMM55_08490, partial [Thermohalobaculum sp.]|nr:hypothetical protein [Thermohalobaculum sp.]